MCEKFRHNFGEVFSYWNMRLMIISLKVNFYQYRLNPNLLSRDIYIKPLMYFLVRELKSTFIYYTFHDTGKGTDNSSRVKLSMTYLYNVRSWCRPLKFQTLDHLAPQVWFFGRFITEKVYIQQKCATCVCSDLKSNLQKNPKQHVLFIARTEYGTMWTVK